MSGVGIVNISGGLGNQLFQYFFGQILTHNYGKKVFYDVSDFKSYRIHEGLVIEKYFDIQLPLVTLEELQKLPIMCRSRFGKRFALNFFSCNSFKSKIHTDRSFTQKEFRANYNLVEYFLGYWQSQVYNSEQLSLAKKLLRFRLDLLTSANESISKANIVLDHAAVIHVRRGDFVKAPSRAPHYALPLDFYVRSIDFMVRERNVSRFYIFSDEIEWVKLNFPKRYDMYFIDSKISNSPGLDMCLMSRFANMIISNSTFGWWAAALRENESGLVLYPKEWVKSKFLNDQTKNVKIPEKWHPINVN